MIIKKVIDPHRIRTLQGGFSYISHRFLTDGFLASLSQKEILLYFFLVLASDRHGLSFYSYDAICSFLQIYSNGRSCRQAIYSRTAISCLFCHSLRPVVPEREQSHGSQKHPSCRRPSEIRIPCRHFVHKIGGINVHILLEK